jgi:hypothetical protein
MKRKLTITLLLVLVMVIMVPLSVSATAAAPDISSNVAKRALAINAPETAAVGENIKVQVVERYNNVPVGGVGVWAVKFSSAESPAVDVISAASNTPEIFLGWTDDNGVVVSAFKQVGPYILAAFKDTCNPGFARIMVKTAVKALGIKVPDSGVMGEPVTMLVFDRNTGAGVARVGVWAVSSADLPVPTASSQDDSAALIQKVGQFLGWTDDAGKLTFKIGQPGRYLLAAFKDGNLPGFAKFAVKPPVTATPTEVNKATAAAVKNAPQPVAVSSSNRLTAD